MTFSDVSPDAKKYLTGQEVCRMIHGVYAIPFDKIFCFHVIAHFADGEQRDQGSVPRARRFRR